MKTRLADAAHNVLGNRSSPIGSVIGGLSAARVRYDMTMFSLHLSLVNWRRRGMAGRRRLTCTAIRCQLWEGMQS
jgi:hypothetical protein